MPAPLDPERRARLVAALEDRAHALALSEGLVEKALARCVRHDLRSGRLGAQSGRHGPFSPPDTSTPVTIPPTPAAAPAPAAEPSAPTLLSRAEGPPPPPPPTGDSRSPSLEAGRILAGYRIEGLLGVGGMGHVYRATQLSMNRQVAFKVLAPRLARNPRFRERFLREARAAGRLQHPNLIAVHDVGEADGLLFFSMELVEGRSLKEIIAAEGGQPAAMALDIAQQALEGLRFAHGRGVVHRDIKPDNLMLTGEGRVKIADLGLARAEVPGGSGAADLFETQAGTIMGTPHYMSPEQGRDAHLADQRSDLYSLGATLFHLLWGRVPFDGLSPMAVVLAASTQELKFPERPPHPPAVRVFIARLMAKRPEDRPQDADQALAMLAAAQAGQEAPKPRLGRWRRWRRRLAWLLAVALVVAVVGGAVAWSIDRHWQDGWERARDQALARATPATGEFAMGLSMLRDARTGMREGSRRMAECDELIARLTGEWDAWAVGRTREDLAHVHDALAAGRFDDAEDRLGRIRPAMRSPKVAAEIEALTRELVQRAVEAVRGGGARTATAPARGEGPPLLEEWRRRLGAQLVADLRAEPAGSLMQVDGGMRLSGEGRATLPDGMLRRLAERRLGGMQLTLRFPAGSVADRWDMEIGGGRRLVALPTALELQDASGRSERLCPPVDGQISFSLIHREDALTLVHAGGNPLRLAAAGDLVMRWKVSPGAGLRLELRAVRGKGAGLPPP